MYKLDQEKQFTVNQEKIAHILSAYSISDFTFEPINEGIANTSFAVETGGKKYVLRIYAQDRNNDDGIIFELNFQDYLRENGIPIPTIYKNHEGKELNITKLDGKRWQSILMEFVEGDSKTLNPSLKLISELAGLQAKMHILGIDFVKKSNKPKTKWLDLHDSLAKKIENVPGQTKEVLELIERVKTYSYPLSPELSHGYNHLDIDLDGNVITKGNKVQAIVDFDDLSYSPVVVCLGFTLWNILDDHGLDSMKQYLKEYENIRPLTSLEHKVLPHAIFFRNYAIGMIRLLLWGKDTKIQDIENIIQLEKDIPKFFGIAAPERM